MSEQEARFAPRESAPTAEDEPTPEIVQVYSDLDRTKLIAWFQDVAFPKLAQEFGAGLRWGMADFEWSLAFKDDVTGMQVWLMKVAKATGEQSFYAEPNDATLHRLRLLLRASRAWHTEARWGPVNA